MTFPRDPSSGTIVRSVWLLVLVGCFGRRDECAFGDARCRGNVAEVCDTLNSEDPTLVWSSHDCDPDRTCVVNASGSVAVCSIATTPDPFCGAADLFAKCDGAHLVACHAGFRTDEIDCGAPELCQASRCVLLPAPDPLCKATSFDHVCDGQVAVTCLDGWRIRATDCGDVSLCHQFSSGYTSCITSNEPDPRCADLGTGYADGYFCEGDRSLICHREIAGMMLVEQCAPEQCFPDELGRPKCHRRELRFF